MKNLFIKLSKKSALLMIMMSALHSSALFAAAAAQDIPATPGASSTASSPASTSTSSSGTTTATTATTDGTTAASSTTAAEPPSGMMAQLLMLGAFGFIFYFLIWRPQNKRAKQQRDLISSLQKGDEVITAGGILGKIQRIKDDFLVLSISEGTEILVQRQAIAGTLPKGTMKDI